MTTRLKALKKIYGELCVYCAKNIATTVDHIIPVCRYGANVVQNLLPSCKKCNQEKNYSSIYDFCPKDALLRIDDCRRANKYIQLSQYTLESDLPIERKKSKKSPLNTQQKLSKLKFTKCNQVLMGYYLYSEIYKTDRAKRIISHIYQSEYIQAINKMKEYNSSVWTKVAVKTFCRTEDIFNHYIRELIKFFNKKREYEIKGWEPD